MFIYPLLLVFYEMAAYLSNDLYLPALPSIMNDLKISSSMAQTTLTGWFIGSASLQLILGPISDRFGRRPVLLYSGILFVVASAACAMAGDITTMIIARFFQGMVVCAVIVAGYASIHELLESEQAVKTIAWMSGVAVLAPALGPLFGGVLLLFASWRWLFIILAIWGAILVLMLRHWMPESLPAEKRLKFNLSKVFRDYWQVVGNQQFLINVGTFCLLFAGAIAWMPIGPLLIIRDFHRTPVWYGIIQIFLLSSYIIGTWAIRFLIRYRGVEGTLKIGLPVALAGMIMSVSCAYIWPNRLFYIVISLMVFQLGCGLSLAPLNRLSIESTQQPMGIRVALFSFLMGWCGVISIATVSIFYNGTLYSFAWVMLLFTLGAVILKSLSMLKKIISQNN